MAALSDDDFAKMLAAQQPVAEAAPEGPLSDEDFAKKLAAPRADPQGTAAGPAELRPGHAVLNGLSFGLWPRIEAAAKTHSFSGDDYEKAKNEIWDKDAAYSAENPVTAFALEAAGALPTMFVPGLGAGRIAQAAARVGGAATNLGRGARLARIAGVGSEIGTTGSEAAAMGAKSAALTGALGSHDDTLSGRLASGVIAAPFGYAGGRVGDAIGSRVAGAVEGLHDMARVGGNSTLGALQALRRGLDRDGTTTAALRDAVLPNMGRTQIPQGGREVALTAYQDAVTGGAPENAARRAAETAYAAHAQAQGSNLTPATLRNHTRNIIRDYADQNGDVPLAIDEVSRLAGGSGQNLAWTRRAAAASPGAGKEELFNGVTRRQEDILPAVQARVRDSLGDENVLGAKTDLVTHNRDAEHQLYDMARQNEAPFDLTPAFDEANATHAFRGGKARDTMQEAMRVMRGDPLADGSYQPHTLDTYIQSRSQLNDMIQDSMNVNPVTGQQSGTTATRALIDLKGKMDNIVGQANPQWRWANDITRGGRSLEHSMDDGMRMTLSGGDNHTETVLNRVQQMRQRIATIERNRNASLHDRAEANVLRNQIQSYQAGFAKTVHGALSKQGDTHDVSKLFMKGGRNAQAGPRRVINIMMGDEAPAFMATLRRGQIASTTYKNQFGSQTTPLRETIDELNENGKVAGAVRGLGYFGHPMQALSDLSEAIGRRLNEGRNTELLRRYTTTTENPANFLRLLEELDNHALQRGRAFTNPNFNAYTAPGVASGAFSSAGAQE